jgi:HEAT repeat protein
VGALGKIGGADAAKALDGLRVTASPKLRPYVIDAYLQCADKMLKEDKNDEAAAIYKAVYVPAEPKPTRIAGLRGLVLALGVKAMPMVAEVLAGNDAQMQAIALSFAGEIPGPEATKALADLLPKLPAPGQALLLAQLGRRGDMAAKPAVLGSLKSADDAVRTAAFGALATIGDASDVPALAQAAAGGGAEADAARNSLATMKAQNANAAMLAAMTGDAKVRAELLRALTARKSAEAAPAMLKAADDADAAVRAEAFKGLEAVADEKCLAPMIALLIKTKDTDAAEKALLATCGRATNKDVALQVILTPLASAQMPAKGSLLKALGRLGGPKAILPVRAALKDADMGVREAAVRALADWSDMTAAPDLIAVGKSEGKLTLKVLALRGYLRLAALPEVPAAQKLQMSQEALTVITRPDEKKLVLGVLADVNQPAALLIVVPMLDDNALKNEACTAAVKIAKSLGNNLPPETRAAMEKCLTITKDKKLITDANDVMKRIKPAKK